MKNLIFILSADLGPKSATESCKQKRVNEAVGTEWICFAINAIINLLLAHTAYLNAVMKLLYLKPA